MRRLAGASAVAALVVWVPPAVAGTTPPRATVTGKITSLGVARVTVTGDRKLTCRVGDISPRALGYVLGSGTRITCVNGLLTRIVGIDRPLPPIVGTIGPSGSVAIAATGALGPISALSGTSVTIAGLTCPLTAGSPDLTGYAVGDRVVAGCSNGALTFIRPAPDTAADGGCQEYPRADGRSVTLCTTQTQLG